MATKKSDTPAVTQPPISATSLVAITTEKTAMLALGAQMKEQVTKLCSEVKAIVIKDDATLQVFKQKLTELNKLDIAVKKRGKELREPYNLGAKMIIAAENFIVGEIAAVVLDGKNAMLEYEKKARVLAEEAAQKAEITAAKEIAANNANAEVEAERVQVLTTFKTQSIQQMAECLTLADLKSTYVQILSEIEDQEFKDENEKTMLKNDLIKFKDTQKTTVEAIEKAKASGDAKAQLIAKQKAELDAFEAGEKIRKEQEAAAEKARLETLQREEESKAALMGIQHHYGPNIGPKRTDWDFEVDDFGNVPDDWKTVDDSKIKLYIKENKEKLTDGCIVDGIKFIANVTPVLK